MAMRGTADVSRPSDQIGIAEALNDAGQNGIALRGAGCSYGDAAMNSGGRVLDMTRMNRILGFDTESGIATVEPGVTIRDLWRHSIQHKFWPAVVPGTMEVSMGGAASMNIHGKNHFATGTFGENILEFTLATPTGDLLVCSPQQNPDVYHAAISGFGMLGVFTELKVKTKRVHSGRLKVWGILTRDLEDNMAVIEDSKDEADYLVGWLDLHAKGRALGRGVMHRADQCKPGEDPEGESMFAPDQQDVPLTLFGVVPKGWIWPGMMAAVKMGMIPLVNALKYRAGLPEALGGPHLQGHGGFHFLLDYVPRWQWAFKPGGLIQFQPFIPAKEAARVLRQLIELCHKKKRVPYLGVLKRHRPDPFLMSYAVDGFSMAMDFGVPTSESGRKALWQQTREMAEIVLEAGGKFYYAKDATLLEPAFERIHGAAAVDQFRELKARLDPNNVLQSDLSRRLMG